MEHKRKEAVVTANCWIRFCLLCQMMLESRCNREQCPFCCESRVD